MERIETDQKVLESIAANLKREGWGLSPEKGAGVGEVSAEEVSYL